jgi:hypothetical protein
MSWFSNKGKELTIDLGKDFKKMPELTEEELLCSIHSMTHRLKKEHKEGNTTKRDTFLKRYNILIDALNCYDWCSIKIYEAKNIHLYLDKDSKKDTVSLKVINFEASWLTLSSPEHYDPYDECLFEKRYGRFIIYAFTDHYETILKNVRAHRQAQINEMYKFRKTD